MEVKWKGYCLSHPVWVRGLKLLYIIYLFKWHQVAPRVGAWIETYKEIEREYYDKVAPRVGAWIETYKEIEREYYDKKSHPVWVRGLKRQLV